MSIAMSPPAGENAVNEGIYGEIDDGQLPVDVTGVTVDLEALGVAELIQFFVRAYEHRAPGVSDEEWLQDMFHRHQWATHTEMRAAAQDVVATVGIAYTKKEDLQKAVNQGASRNHWLEGELVRAATTRGTLEVGSYGMQIDVALQAATENAASVIQRFDGEVSLCRNLDGFIAEQHHVDSFNVDAVVKGSDLRAQVLTPEPGSGYAKNSVDIGIYDGNGKLIRRYQSKYGADSEATKKCFENGDYRGQRKLVPEGQSKDIPGSTERIEAEGVFSKPLTKTNAKRQQQDAQAEGSSREYRWKDAGAGAIAKRIGMQALAAAAVACAVQAARILGTRAWNSLRGKTNPPTSEATREFFESSVLSGAHAGLMTAVVGAVLVAVKRGMMGKLLQATPAGRVANIIFVAMENAKVLYKLGCGELTPRQALDAMAEVTTISTVSLVVGAQGMAAGAAIGTVMGPPGVLIGGMIGGIVAGLAGGVVGQKVYAGMTIIVRVRDAVLKEAASQASAAAQVIGRKFTAMRTNAAQANAM